MYSVGKNYVVIDCNVSCRLNPSHGVQRGFQERVRGAGCPLILLLCSKAAHRKTTEGKCC